MSDKRLPIGSYAIATEESSDITLEMRGRVVKHGRDSAGVYTEIEDENSGERLRFHRSNLRAALARAKKGDVK